MILRDRIIFSIAFLMFFTSAVFFLSGNGITGNFLATPSAPMISYSSLSAGMAALYLLGMSLKKKSGVEEVTYMELYKNALIKKKETENLMKQLPTSKSFRGICEIFLSGIVENNFSKLRLPMEFQDFLTEKLRGEKNILELEKVSKILYNSYSIALKSENVPKESIESLEILYNQTKHFTLSAFKNKI